MHFRSSIPCLQWGQGGGGCCVLEKSPLLEKRHSTKGLIGKEGTKLSH